MAELTNVGGVGSELSRLLQCANITPGDQASYEMCKIIWAEHPLGGKLVEKPITMALFKPRINNVDDDPDDKIVKAFEDAWLALGVTEKIRNLFFLVRCYGAAAIGVGTINEKSEDPLGGFGLSADNIFINVWDPLNAAGSMVTDQQPNSPDFQRPDDTLNISGQKWHPSRTMKIFNGAPIYLGYQRSAFGYTGRSVFQRALYPLQSFINTMVTDNLVSKKAGVIIAKVQQNSSVISNLMGIANIARRKDIKDAENEGVLSIGQSDSIESMDLQNIDKAMTTARDNIISNIAAASDTPSFLMKDEAFANGFGDGKEDSKAIAQYIDSVRQTIEPVILFFERIVQYIAWSEDFFNALKASNPEIISGEYQETFLSWRRSFRSKWPELMEKSPEEKQDADSKLIVRAIKYVSAMAPLVDPINRTKLIEWSNETINTTYVAKNNPIVFDYEYLQENAPPLQVSDNGQQDLSEKDII
ncbi:MAG: anti-CBASS protein Acb1 family protein [Serratia sp. (in: enterobacteria)]|uniref:anti-CBASS protein Acb1 family protein n=1 Tax=Serratia sp. (in: enterobacteria) TaxID=616 RepID=UPI003F385C57